MMLNEAKKCLACLKPFCESGCPLHNHIRDFIQAYKAGDILTARQIVAKENPFPYLTSRICAFEKQCRGHCVKNHQNDPVHVGLIERSIAEYDLPWQTKADNGKKIAVIGSGVAGLTIAKLALIEGYKVDIYDREKFAGGTVLTGIPEYRLDRKYVLKAVNEIKELGGKFILGQSFFAEMLDRYLTEYDRVVLSLGTMAANRMGIVNEEKAADGLKVLYDLNILNKAEKYRGYRKIHVVGGGNVALDCARSLKRIADEVTIVYRRTRQQMPANESEIIEALSEGVKIMELTNPYEVRDDGFYADQMVLGETDASGRPAFKKVEGSGHFVPSDLLVMAIGQKVKTADLNGIQLDQRQRIAVNDHYETSIKRVYACGDCVSGASNVASAIQSAKECFKGMTEDENEI